MRKKDKDLLEQLILEFTLPDIEDFRLFYSLLGCEYDGSRKVFNPKAVRSVMDIGLIEAYRTGEMKYLHNGLFTYNLLNFPYYKHYSSRSDEYILCKNIVEAFAACDIESIKKHCPADRPILTSGYKMWFLGYNIILGMLYKDESRLSKGIQQAEKALTTKLPKFDMAVIAYLLALVRQDIGQANIQFSEMLDVYRKSSGLFEFGDPFTKVFGLLPHGFYNMAYYFLPADDFVKIIPPKGTVFWNELAEYQKGTGFVRGEHIEFSGNLIFLNELYNKNCG
jgi:hypothetical protein